MTPLRSVQARGLAWAALATFVWLAAMAWARPLSLPDEGRYVGVAWEMLRSGEWLTPTLNGLPYFHKPPLFYWITAGALSLFGLNEWAARAAPLLGAWVGALAMYLFVRRWIGERHARLALVALLAQPLFYVGGQFANLDMLVAGFITATIVSFAHAALCAEQGLPHRRALAAAYAFAAAGVLAKGLIGAVIPSLVIVAWLLARRRWRALRALVWLPGVAIFLALAAPWFVAMQWRFDDFLHYFFVVQHFGRFAAGGFNNVQPFWFFPAALLLLGLPWLPWLVRAFLRGDADGAGHAGIEARDTRGAVRLLMLLWVSAVVLFFSLPQSKLVGYVLPAVPPLAVLMAEGLTRLGEPSRRAWRLWWASAAVSAAVGIGAVATFAIHPLKSSREVAAVLAAQRAPGDAVFMLGNYYFDVPFYARLPDRIGVVDQWHSEQVMQRDNWRKELADAALFAPAAAAARLVTPALLPAALRVAPVSWVIGPATAIADHPVLAQARVMFRHDDTVLWRVEPSQLQIASAPTAPGMPNDGSPDK